MTMVRVIALLGCGLVGLFWSELPVFAQAFTSGSTGSLGAFSPATNTVVTLPADGILNYTTVTIPVGVTVTFQPNAANTPVIMLATGNVLIAGVVNLDGVAGTGYGVNVPPGGAGGPGGFAADRAVPKEPLTMHRLGGRDLVVAPPQLRMAAADSMARQPALLVSYHCSAGQEAEGTQELPAKPGLLEGVGVELSSSVRRLRSPSLGRSLPEEAMGGPPELFTQAAGVAELYVWSHLKSPETERSMCSTAKGAIPNRVWDVRGSRPFV